MELVKLFYMGFVEREARSALIETYLAELGAEMDFLKTVKQKNDAMPPFTEEVLAAMRKEEPNILDSLSADGIQDIALFQAALLDFSIAKLEFEMRWFENFKQGVL